MDAACVMAYKNQILSEKEAKTMKPAAVSLVVLLIVIFPTAILLAQPASSAWPMFRCNAQHTGLGQQAGPLTGALRWSYGTGGPVVSSAAVGYDDKVYVGSQFFSNNVGNQFPPSNVFAIDSAGAIEWSYRADYPVTSSPALGLEGQVYFGTAAILDTFYALTSTGALSWSYEIGFMRFSSPTIGSNGAICIGSFDGNLYVFNTGASILWSYQTGAYIESSPAVGSNGTVLIGTGDGNVYALNSTGSFRWSYLTGYFVWSSPAIGSNGTVLIGSGDNNVYALNPAGSLAWSYLTGNFVQSSPAIGSNGTVLIGSGDNNVYALNPAGSLAWSYLIGNFVWSSPAIGTGGAVFIGSGGINVFAPTSTGTNAYVPTSTDTNVYALNPAGSLSWSYATGNIVESSPSIGSNGALYIGSFDNYLYCFQDPPTPTPTASPQPTPTPSGVLVILNTDIATAGTLVIVDGIIPPIPPDNPLDCYILVQTPPQAAAPPDNPVDCYILVQTPSGQIYSVMLGGRIVVKGIVPCVRGITLADGWSGNLFRKKICKNARGVYTVGLIVMPSGMPINLDRAIGYDLKDLTVVQ